MDNAKVIAALEKFVVFNYFDRLLGCQIHKVVLFPIFPYTAAANLSDPQYFIMVDDLSKLTALNCGRSDN